MNDQTVKTEQDNISERIRQEMQQYGLSQALVSRESGVSAARLSQWLAGAYRGDNESVESSLRCWLQSRRERASSLSDIPHAPAWIVTPTAKKVHTALFYAQSTADVSVIYGGAGVGKTCTALKYQSDNPNVWIATMTPATASLAASFERVAVAVGIREVPTVALRIESAIVEKVRGTGGLLIVDEAQHLSRPALEGIRSLHDATQMGIALLGNESVYAQLTGGARQAHFAQLFSRIGRRLRLNGPEDGDVDALLDAWKVPGEAKKLCAMVAKQNGALRGLTKTLRWASLLAKGEEKPFGATHVKVAWNELGGKA